MNMNGMRYKNIMGDYNMIEMKTDDVLKHVREYGVINE